MVLLLSEKLQLSFEESEEIIDNKEIKHHVTVTKHPETRFLSFLFFIAITYALIYIPPFVARSEEANHIPSYIFTFWSYIGQFYNGAVLISLPLFIASFFFLKGIRIYFSLLTRFIFILIGAFTCLAFWLTFILFVFVGSYSSFIFPFYLVVLFIFLGNGVYDLTRKAPDGESDNLAEKKRKPDTFRSPLERFFYEATRLLINHYFLFPLALFLEGHFFSASGIERPDFTLQIVSF